jgi:hypothetical protein
MGRWRLGASVCGLAAVDELAAARAANRELMTQINTRQ